MTVVETGREDVRDKILLALVTLLPMFALIGNAVADIGLNLVTLGFIMTSSAHLKTFLRSRFLLICVAFWVWILCCSALSDFPQNSFRDSLPWIRFPLYAFALSHLLGRRNGLYIRYLIGAAIGGTLIEIAFLLYEYIFLRGELARLHGTYGKLIAGWYLAGFSLLAVLWSFEKLRKEAVGLPQRLLIIAFAGVTSFGIIITGEVMNTLFFAGTLFLYFVIRKSYSLQTIGLIVAGVGVVLALGVAASFLDPLLQERLIHSITTRLPWMTSSDYYIPFKMGLETAWQNLGLGVGPKNSNAYCMALLKAGQLIATLDIDTCYWHPHNLYIQIAAETGLIGLVMFIGLAGYVLLEAIKDFADPKNDSNLAILLAFALFFPIQTYFQAFGQFKNFYFWSLLGVVLFMIRDRKKADDQAMRL